MNAPKKENLNVLVVDDDEFQTDLLTDLLEDMGISNVTAALGGERGLQVFDKSTVKPDLIICDIQMPGIDGFEFMKKIGQKGYRGAVILMSGQGVRVLNSASLVAQLSIEGFLGNIEKPVTQAQLQHFISKMF